MNKIMITPSLAFISDSIWSKQGFKDQYFEKMINSLREIDADENLRLIWTYKLEEILWTEPRYKPWSELKEKNTLVPIFYKFFSTNCEYIEHSNIEANSNPIISHEDQDVQCEYHRIFNYLIDNKIDFALYELIVTTIITSNSGIAYKPIHCSCSYDIRSINIENHLNSDISKRGEILTHIISLYIEANNLKKVNHYSFTPKFLNKFCSLTGIEMKQIIERLALRISYSSLESRKCRLLQDEYIDAHGVDEFRMRISNWPTSKRVHYIINENEIVFQQYYGEGEHDDGL